MELITTPFGFIMKFCYNLFSNYALAIILFTFLTKIILFPVSIWTHINSLRLVKLQPELNFLKAKYYGDKETISNEQLKLYKKEKYHPLLGVVPMLVQLFLLMCVIQIIYNPLTHILSYDKSVINTLIAEYSKISSIDPTSNSVQLYVVSAIQNGFHVNGIDTSSAKELNTYLFGFNLSVVPNAEKGAYLAMPFLTGLSALMLSLFQNRINPLQAEQNKGEQILTSSVSVIISLVLGGFVPAGIGFYWICSNVFAMLQQIVLNAVISPKKHIDYDRLEESRKELKRIEDLSETKISAADKRKEKHDYKRFFSVENKHFVVYAESNGFYRYFRKTIEYILENSNIVIHYVTSDPYDSVFERENERLKAYYIGFKKMVPLFMKMDAEIVLMTTPDLDNFQYKRSYVKKDIEYIYTMHGAASTHLVQNKNYLDNFDTVFLVNKQQESEIRKREELYSLPAKKLVITGYGFLELLQESYDKMPKEENEKKVVLIAPSWQKDNILDSCIDSILSVLLNEDYKIIIRPHPEYMKRYQNRMEDLIGRYSDVDSSRLVFETDFSASESLYKSDILITDWSTVAHEFSYITLRPSVFVDTPAKIKNKDYKEIGIEPLDFSLRNKIGKSISTSNLSEINSLITDMLINKDEYKNQIRELRDEFIANYGHSGEVSGKYIIRALIDKQKKSKGE